MMAIEDHAIEYGKLFGSWQIRELIGTGSKGRTKVYRITKDSQGGLDAGEERALKAVTICEDVSLENMTANAKAEYDANRKMLIEKASNEVFLMKRLEGAPHIVGYLDWEIRDRTGGTDLLIAMHLLDTLEQLQRETDSFSEEDVLQVGMDICKALIRCQEEGIIHRDIKPANIFRRQDGRGGYLLGDFGVSRIVDRGMGASTEIGTPAYAAPEQVRRGSYDSRVDIYSLGVVLYEMSNRNRLPFAGSRYSTREIIERRVILGEEIPAPSDASPALASVILQACAFDPESRFQTAKELLNALEGIRNGRITELSVSDAKSESELDPYATMPVASFVQEDLLTVQKAEDIPKFEPKAPQFQLAQKQNPQSIPTAAVNEDFREKFHELYQNLVNYREALRNGEIDLIYKETAKLQLIVQELHLMSERYQYTQKEMAGVAASVINQYNKYVVPFNAFSNASDKLTDEAQEFAKQAEEEFRELINLVVKYWGNVMPVVSFMQEDSLTSQFMELVDKAYSFTVLYRKLLNSSESTEEKEMEVINQLHATINDIYFFYENNSNHPKAATALSLVDIYNEFLSQFKNFINLRNAGNNSRKEADKTSARFSALVDALLNARRG